MPLIQERAKTLGEIVPLTRFFFVDEIDYQDVELIGKNMTEELTLKALETAGQKLSGLKEFSDESLEELLRPLAVDLEIKTGQLFSALRVATTGETAAPPLFQTMTVLGKDKCLERIKKALVKLQGLSA